MQAKRQIETEGLPHNIEAERSVLGAILLDNNVFHQARELLSRDDFYLDSHRRIFKAIDRACNKGRSMDLISIGEELKQAGDFERVGGATQITSFIDSVVRTDDISTYATIIKEKADRRRLLTFSEQISSQVLDGEKSVETIIADVAQGLTQFQEAPTNGKLIHADSLDLEPPIDYLFANEISACSLTVLYAESGAGKSFLALDYALHIAQSKPVVYIAAEGAAGYRARKNAWCDFHKCRSGGLYFWREGVNLLDTKAVHQFTTGIKAIEPVFVVLDTLARCMVGGDENAAKDMGLAIDAITRIQQQTGATVLAVHHTGKNGASERGSSALRAAADSMIELINEDGLIMLQCSKAKDSAPFKPRYLRLVQSGESCVLVSAEKVIEVSLPNNQRKILQALNLPIYFDKEATRSQIGTDSGLQDSALSRALSALISKGMISQKGGRYTRYHITAAGKAAIEPNYQQSYQPDKTTNLNNNSSYNEELSELSNVAN